jgi:outer membrane protein TolC
MCCTRSLRVAVAAAFVAALSGQAAAQQGIVTPVTPVTPTAAQPDRIEAPVMRFPPEGVTLEDAVTLALQHDPNLQRQRESARFGQGVLQEQSGPFDLTLLGGANYEYRIQELTEARKQSERDKRSQIQQFLTDNRGSSDRARALIPLLEQLQTSSTQQIIDQINAIDPSIAGMLQLFDRLIAANASNPALQAELRAMRERFIRETLANLNQSLKDFVAGYDQTTKKLADLGAPPDDEVFYNAGFNMQFSKLFRQGVSVGPYLDMRYEGTNYVGKPRSDQFGGKGLEDLFTFHAGTTFLFPLGRGRGYRATAGPERAAARERDAAQLLFEHQASLTTLATVLAYWDARTAQDNLAAIQRAVDIQGTLVGLTRKLIDAGDLPGVELARAQAAEARARAQLADADRQVRDARVALATAIGVAVTSDEATLPRARDGFPPVPDTAPPAAAALIPEALQRRQDVEAANKREEAGRVLQDTAETNLRPRLDVIGSSWYTALEERTVSRAIDRWVGPSASLQFQLERPFGNNLFRGQLVQREADASARRIAAIDTQRQVGLGVVQAAAGLADAIARVRQAQASVGFYDQIVKAEVSRFETGDATLIDTVLQQQQQTEALLSLIAAQRELSRLIAQLRYQTASLLAAGGNVARPNLTTPPQAGSVR